MIVNMIWIGDEIPLLQRMCINSWLANGHRIRLWFYDEIRNVPPGVDLVPAGGRESTIYRYEDENHKGSPVLHANLWRYALLADGSEAVADADTLCLRPFSVSTAVGKFRERQVGRSSESGLCFSRRESSVRR